MTQLRPSKPSVLTRMRPFPATAVLRAATAEPSCDSTPADFPETVRLTAVGDRLFAARIDGSPGLDWRRRYDDLAYTLIGTPADVAKGVRDYLAMFGLVYGAFDFGLDAAGRFHWYECNPNGQFAWFPGPLTRRITTAIADQLHYPNPDSR